MKHWALVAIVVVVLLAVPLSAALYKLQGVKRVDKDLYRSADKIYIQTRYCYEYAYYEDVLYDDAKRVVYFESGTRCDVVRVFR